MYFPNIPTLGEWQRASSSTFQVRANKPKLVRIDNLIAKYHQVFDMARLNLLMELKTAVVDWAADKIERDASSGRLQAMRALEEVVVRKLTELDGWTKHRYTKVACLGYAVKAGDYDAKCKAPTRIVRNSQEQAEVATRCAELVTAIRAAHQKWTTRAGMLRYQPADDRRTLKIFMAPEFYFRGPYGAYADLTRLDEIFNTLRLETSTAKYTDWLFVLGTAITAWDDGSGKLQLNNYALVQKGGPKGGSELHEFTVAKEFPSHIDFVHQGVTNPDWYNPAKSQATIGGQTLAAKVPTGARLDTLFTETGARRLDQSSSPRVTELVGGCIFTMHGITFGLEVCRDHLLGRLADSTEKGKVQIQLVPSCGASIANPACMPGGVIFNVDALAPHAQFLVQGSGRQPAKVTMANGAADKVVLFDPATIPYPGMNQGAAWTQATPLAVAQKLKQPMHALIGTPAPPPRPVR